MVMVDTSSSPVPAATLSTPPTPGDPNGKPDMVNDEQMTKSEIKAEITRSGDTPSKLETDGEIDAIRIGEDGKFSLK